MLLVTEADDTTVGVGDFSRFLLDGRLRLLVGDGGPEGKCSDMGLGRGGAPEDKEEVDEKDDAKE